MNFILSTLLFFSTSSFANEKLRIYEKEKYQTFEIKTYQSLKLSADCLKSSPPKCMAYQSSLKKLTPEPHSAPLIGNPAARYCLTAGGENRIVKDSKNSQYDYCRFKDGSLINSWDLYTKYYPSEKILAK